MKKKLPKQMGNVVLLGEIIEERMLFSELKLSVSVDQPSSYHCVTPPLFPIFMKSIKSIRPMKPA
jgi:hypothetical protein